MQVIESPRRPRLPFGRFEVLCLRIVTVQIGRCRTILITNGTTVALFCQIDLTLRSAVKSCLAQWLDDATVDTDGVQMSLTQLTIEQGGRCCRHHHRVVATDHTSGALGILGTIASAYAMPLTLGLLRRL